MHFLPLAQGRCGTARASMSASVGDGWRRPQLAPSHLPKIAPRQTLRSRSSRTARLLLGIKGGEATGEGAAR
eukprot:3034114-Alexandrium_andersonii.AAC.1